MKYFFVFIVLVLFSLSIKAAENCGVVEKVNGVEVIVRNQNIASPFKIGEMYHVLTGDSVVILKAIFPMQTIAKCRVVKGQVSNIRKGMRVFAGIEPDKCIPEAVGFTKKQSVHLNDYIVTISNARTIFTTWNESLKLLNSGSGIVYFTADTHNEVNIAFSSEVRSTNQMYVFCVGGWLHTRSIISKGAQGALEAGNGKTCASTYKSIRKWKDRYWVKLDKVTRTISIGYGDKAGENIILEWIDPEYLENLRYFAFSCWADEAKYENILIESLP
ncbi:MAG TPA: hypothetical protein PL161_13040 [Spirochaetota bacterium]|nr:hypothetical protein [Spirochaetota bacterium]HPY04140.1 hypothetical protein [Spirochaetota bacterium]